MDANILSGNIALARFYTNSCVNKLRRLYFTQEALPLDVMDVTFKFVYEALAERNRASSDESDDESEDEEGDNNKSNDFLMNGDTVIIDGVIARLELHYGLAGN
jgi:hypothetical protein